MAITNQKTRDILYIDDDPNWTVILPELGKILGFNIISTCSVDKCLSIIDKNDDLSLFITDIRMANTSGYDLIKEIRRRIPDIPVMIITGYKTDKLNEFVKQYAVDSVLLKPFSVVELQEALNKIVL